MSFPLPQLVETLIVGAGFSGICLAIKLRQAQRTSFLLIDKSSDIGGTWNLNRYPGCACDVPAHLYSFSFELNPDWSHVYADRSEIQRYLKFCAKKYCLQPHIFLETEMLEAVWDESAATWHVRVLHDKVESKIDARFLVCAVGPLHVPKYPELEGRHTFAGPSFHSTYWDHSVELDGKSVAIIGTGASAVQIVPEIATVARRVNVYQRTPGWIVPRKQCEIRPFWRRLFRRVPLVMRSFYYFLYWRQEILLLAFLGVQFFRKRLEAASLMHMERTIHDPELRVALTPKYDLGCKRVMASNDFYPAITRSNVKLVTRSIKEVREKSIVCWGSDGEEEEEEVEVIVYATGFEAGRSTMRVMGRGGLELKEAGWATMLGVTKAGFPNFFMLLGPNTILGHSSLLIMVEAQVRYVMSCMQLLLGPASPVSGEACSVELRNDSQDRFQQLLQRRFPGTVWQSGKCHSWYRDARLAHSHLIWPAFTMEYLYRTWSASASDYHIR